MIEAWRQECDAIAVAQAIRTAQRTQQAVKLKLEVASKVKLYPRLIGRAVPFRKRLAAEGLLAWLSATNGEKTRPSIRWFCDPNADDLKLIERESEYIFDHVVTIGPVDGVFLSEPREIWLHETLDDADLVRTVAHEFCHSMGIRDEDEAEVFGIETAKKLTPLGGCVFVLQAADDDPKSNSLGYVARPGDSIIRNRDLFVKYGTEWRRHSEV